MWYSINYALLIKTFSDKLKRDGISRNISKWEIFVSNARAQPAIHRCGWHMFIFVVVDLHKHNEVMHFFVT